MADFYSEGAGAMVTGASRSLADVSREDFTSAFPARSNRPRWATTRFPVSMEEYRRLTQAAERPDAPSAAAAFEDTARADVDAAALAGEEGLDPPEGAGLTVASMQALAPPVGVAFEGIPATAWRPPDNTCAVGPDHVMLAVNTDLAVYNKNGVLRFRWPNMTTLFRPVLPSNAGLFDPRVAYDHYTRRWIVVISARRETPAGSWLMVGVSQGADPGGAWWVWALDAMADGSTATNNWADYPMLGFDTQAIYIVSNMFRIGDGFQYCKLRILNKVELYAGGVGPGHNIRWYDFWNLKNVDNSVAFTVQPCTHFRGTGGNPPAYLVNALWPSGSKLTVWTLTNPIALWSGGTPTLARQAVDCRNYDLPPDAEQSGTSTRIETNDSRLLNAVYQNVGGVQRLWTCHTSKITWSGESVARSAVQWYEIDVPSKRVVQQNGYGARGAYYFFPAIQTDVSRNAYVVFSRSSASEFGSVRQTGRRVNAPANDLENSGLIKAGESAYLGARWGDYFGVSRDGGDAGRVWVYGEYAESGGQWGTWVASLKF